MAARWLFFNNLLEYGAPSRGVVPVVELQAGEQGVAHQRYDIGHDQRQVVNKHTVNNPESNTDGEQERLPDRDVTRMAGAQGFYELGDGRYAGQRAGDQSEVRRAHGRFLPSKLLQAQ